MYLSTRSSAFSLLLLFALSGLAACVVRGSGAAGPGPGPGGPPPPGGPAGPPPGGPAADACPQELGADAPDTQDGAPSIDVGSHQGCYGLDDRKDTYALTAPAHPGPVLYRVRVSGPGAMGCLVATDADRAILRQLNTCAKNPGAALDAFAVVMGGTQWFLETRDLVGDALRNARPYTLEIQATPLADPGEPDAMDRPVPLALGQAAQALMVNAANADKLDNDYYVVEVPKNLRKKTRFQVVISDVPDDVHMVLQVMDADGKRLYNGSGANPGATLRAEVKMKGPGKYLFHLRNLRGDNRYVAGIDQPMTRVIKPYTITVSVP